MVKIVNKPSIEDFKKIWETNTASEVAKFFDVSKSTVDRWVKSFELFKYKREYPKLTSLQKDLITGSLLGDGSISKVGTFVECHSITQKDYLVWKKDILQPFSYELCYGVTNSEFPNGKKRKKESEVCSLYTTRHDIFRKIEKDWYLRDNNNEYILNKHNRRIKKIPKNLNLNSFILAVWFCDDGRNSPSHRNAHISTDSFTKDECIHLSNLIMSKFKIKTKVVPTKLTCQHEIYVPTTSYISFINTISPHIKCKSMQYKIDLSDYTEPTIKVRPRLEEKEILNIFKLKEEGKSIEEISNEVNSSKPHVGNVLRKKHWKEITKQLITPKMLNANNSTGMFGVHKDRDFYCVQVKHNKKVVFKKRFKDIDEAAHHYDYYKIKFSGESVKLNFPDYDYSDFKPIE